MRKHRNNQQPTKGKVGGKTMHKFKDIEGVRFGKLVVLQNRGSKNGTAVCQCDCGNTIEVRRDNLFSGHTKSCGCIKARRHKMNKPVVDLATEEEQLEEMINTPFENRRRLSSINKKYHTSYKLRNKPKTSKRNSSGYTGVFWDKKARRWKASIAFRGKYIYLGSFIIFDDAVQKRKEVEEELFAPAIEVVKKYSKKSMKCVDNQTVA